MFLQDLAGYYCSSGRVRVARVLEMQTRHSTRQCRFLRTKTHRRPTGPSVWVGIGLASGGLAGLSGFDQVWTALLKVHHIKCNGTKFQMLKECFPNQFHQPKRVSTINLGKTHEMPKDLKTKLHNRKLFHNEVANDPPSPDYNDT